MLKTLNINNIVLIDNLSLEFNHGLTVLTGETGSGKSILLDALGLIIGSRMNSRLIGDYANKSIISAEFDISNNKYCKKILEEHDLIADENTLMIRRIIYENSINKIFINDIPVTQNLLSIIGATLIEIHGQHEQQSLLNNNQHLLILDEFSSNHDLISKIKILYNNLQNIDKEIEDLENKKSGFEREYEYLTYSIKEINDMHITENEEEILKQQKEQLTNKNKINEFLQSLNNNLNEVSNFLLNSQKILLKNNNLINNYLNNESQIFNSLDENNEKHLNFLDDALNNINKISKNINSSMDNLSDIDERILNLKTIAKKHNCTIAELHTKSIELSNQLNSLNFQQIKLEELNKSKKDLLNNYKIIAKELSQKRHKSALELSKKVEDELNSLNMQGTKFIVEFIPENFNENKEYNQNGLEKIKFKASLNNKAPDEISKIASGGELSRFMLALKVALMNVRSVPTIIFDEIDAGISAETSNAVGKRLQFLSQKTQILVVTHQPQIASKATNHFKVSKSKQQNKIQTFVEILENDTKILELSRLISGDNIGEETKLVAKKMLTGN